METIQFVESDFITADIVKESTSKLAVILDAGKVDHNKYGDRISFKVQFGPKVKTWKPNKESLLNLQKAFSTESNVWVGKIIRFDMVKDKVVAFVHEVQTSQAKEAATVKHEP